MAAKSPESGAPPPEPSSTQELPLGSSSVSPPPASANVPDPWDRPGRRYGYLVLVAGLVFVADQITKEIIKATMQLGEVIPLIPPVLDLHYITNRGVAFGLFTSLGDIFIPVAVVITTVIIWYYRSLRQRRLWLRTALGLQIGGALGNLVDRLRYGAVIDFVEFHIDAINFHFAVFNVADSAIVVGVGILIAVLLLQPEN